jgi:hypothetical protein
MTDQTLILAVAAAVVVAALAWLAWSTAQTRTLRRHFGPEYDRVVEAAGDRRKAEAELRARKRRVEKYPLRSLPDAERARYLEGWQNVQARFVDEPRQAVVEADRLVGAVMNDCGYPMEDFEQRAADVSVEHPQVVTHYRAAHQVATRDGRFPASTEELRTALLHYRALFEDLLSPGAATPARAS